MMDSIPAAHPEHLLAKPVFSQPSYTPVFSMILIDFYEKRPAMLIEQP